MGEEGRIVPDCFQRPLGNFAIQIRTNLRDARSDGADGFVFPLISAPIRETIRNIFGTANSDLLKHNGRRLAGLSERGKMARFFQLLGTATGVVASISATTSLAQDHPPSRPAGSYESSMPMPAVRSSEPTVSPGSIVTRTSSQSPGIAPNIRDGFGALSPQSQSSYEESTDLPAGFAELCVEMVTETSTYWVTLKSHLEFTLQQLGIWAEIEEVLRASERDDRETCLSTLSALPEADTRQNDRIEQLQFRLERSRRTKLDGLIRRLAATLSPDQRQVLSHRPSPPS